MALRQRQAASATGVANRRGVLDRYGHYRFLGFDAHRQKRTGAEVPICLHPTTLTQLLQFWVPQTPEFEQALLSTMRLPTVLSLMDSDAERVSLKILNALSTFENIGNLPPETTTRILLNDALRQKLRVEDDIARQVELVREALIEENKRAEQRLGEEKLRASQLQQDGEKLQVQLSSATSEMQGLRTELERQRAEALESKSAAQKTEEKLAAYIEQREQRATARNSLSRGQESWPSHLLQSLACSVWARFCRRWAWG